MNLLRAILIYMAVMFTTSVQTTANTDFFTSYTAPTATPAAIVEVTALPAEVETSEVTPAPTVGITPNPDYKTLRVGSSGDEVKKLQQRLTDLGYFSGDIDGRYGNQTRRAVEKFQKVHGLSADGVAGKVTQTVLYESDEVRPAEDVTTPTPVPTEVPALDLATVAPAVAETTLSVTPKAAEAQTSAPTATPTATPAPAFQVKEGYRIVLGQDSAEPLTNESQKTLQVFQRGDVIYLPMIAMLEADGSNILYESSTEGESYAFAAGIDIVSINYSLDQDGNAQNFRVFTNGIENIIQNRDVKLVDGLLYCPASTLQEALGAEITVDDEQKLVRCVFQQTER